MLALFVCLNINAELLLDKKFILLNLSVKLASYFKGDAADDPAIWVNPYNSTNSLVFGTDKRSGIYTFDCLVMKLAIQK